MNWGHEDYAAAAMLLGASAIAVAVILKSVGEPRLRFGLISGVVLLLMVIWAHLAVGIF
jgi:hypothetical protein